MNQHDIMRANVNQFRRENNMSELEPVEPGSDVVDIVQAAVDTIEAPSPMEIMNDLELVIKLFKRHRIADMHFSVKDFLKSLL